MLKVLAIVALLALTASSCSAESGKQLVSINETSGEYQLNESTLSVIEELPGPILVLAAVGDARIGKSTFLNTVYLQWDPMLPKSGTRPFLVDGTAKACTHGVWIYIHRLPEGGSLILVDVEGDNLGNDVVTEQLSALTAVMSSYIILFVHQMVKNKDLEFLFHTAKLGKMFPDSDNFPHLGVAIRDPLDLDQTFVDRSSEVAHWLTSPTHGDGNDKMREEICAVFPQTVITAFEVENQKNLQELSSGPYFDSVKKISSHLKKIIPSKATPTRRKMEMSGRNLAEMIRQLFTALKNGDITALENAYERLEKQMCDTHYSEWIAPLLEKNDDEFMSTEQHHLEEFAKRCKIDSYIRHITQEIKTKKDGITRVRQAKEEERKAQEEKRKAEEQLRIEEEERRRAEVGRRAEEEERKRTEERLRREKAEREGEEKRRIQAEERERKAIAEREEADRRLREARRSGGGSLFEIKIGPIRIGF